MKLIKSVAIAGISLSLAALSFSARANLRSQTLTTQTKLAAPRWMYDPAQVVKSEPVLKAMVAMRTAALEKKWAVCLASAPALAKLAPSLNPWVTRQRIICAENLAKEKGEWKSLELATATVQSHADWLLWGAYAGPLKNSLLDGLTTLLEFQTKSSRKAAWATFEKLQTFEPSLTKEQKAKVFQFGGELAFVEQNLSKALGFYERSLESKPSKAVSERLASIRSKLMGDKVAKQIAKNTGAPLVEGEDSATEELVPPPALARDQSLFLGEEENAIYQTMLKALQSKEYVSAVEDGMKLITLYPGGSASADAELQILKIYLSVAGEKQDEYRLLKQRIVKQMKDGDADRLIRWGENAYWKGFYSDALELSEEAIDKFKGQKEAAKALYLAAKSALFIGEHSTAVKYFKNLTDKFAGSPEAEEALFLLGLYHLRKKEFSEAAAQFERLLAVSQNEKWIYRGLYWHWRSLQKFNKERGVEVAQKLYDKFPLTYYGLRARAEMNGNRLSLPPMTGAKTVSEEFWFSNPENLAWERFQILLKAGWFEEAQFELGSLPEAYSPQGRVVMARLWALAMDHHRAITLMGLAWNEDSTLRTKDVIEIVFPKEFKNYVSREMKGSSLNPNLVYALMRQESSFRPFVVSSSGARGLMQLMVPTAKDMLRPAELKKFTAEDLLVPEMSVKLGVRYLERLKKSYNGHLPLVFAAYNAGIGRVNRWLGSRKETQNLKEQLSSDPLMEIWIDELPWDETSDYVKSVLRNYLIYQMLDSGELALKDPLWLPSDN